MVIKKLPKTIRYITTAIVTVGLVGKAKKAPGTLGSLLSVAAFYLLLPAYLMQCPADKHAAIIPNQQLNFQLIKLVSIKCMLFICCKILLIAVLLLALGCFFVRIYVNDILNDSKCDPKEVVIDEFVGQLIALALCIPSTKLFIDEIASSHLTQMHLQNIAYALAFLPFILFRLFDILKPWPVGYVDKNLKGYLGIMVDDVLAAMLASMTQYAILVTHWALFCR